jgi:Domain of unknown function (DUF4265)
MPFKEAWQRIGILMSISLQFPLDVEDDWPPVGSESLPFRKLDEGYECLSVPLFVKDLSVGDIIQFTKDSEGLLSSWSHLRKSGRSTIWLLRLSKNDQIEPCLHKLRSLGCNTSGVVEFGCYAIDVPEVLKIQVVDEVLKDLCSDLVAVAFPAMRHTEKL